MKMTREGCVVLSDPAQVNSVLSQFSLRDVPITANHLHHDGLAVFELVLHNIISIVFAWCALKCRDINFT